MMTFNKPKIKDSVFFTKEESKYRDEIKDFVSNEVEPKVGLIEQNNDYAIIRDLLRKLGSRGFLGPLHPKIYGGTQLGVIAETIIAEEISAVCFALDLSRLATITLCGMPIQRFGTDERKISISFRSLKEKRLVLLESRNLMLDQTQRE